MPTWFAWDGAAFLVASKPGARKVRNCRSNPSVMLGIARVGRRTAAADGPWPRPYPPPPSRIGIRTPRSRATSSARS